MKTVYDYCKEFILATSDFDKAVESKNKESIKAAERKIEELESKMRNIQC